MSMNTSSDQSRHQYAPVDTAHNFSASSNFPTFSHTPIAVQSQQQSASRHGLRRFQISRKGDAATTSRSYRRRTGIRGAPKRPYSCGICGNAYAQPQGVTRHHREAHQFSVCIYCGNFRWGRPYQLRKHLKEQHPNVDPDTVLGGPIGSRRKATQISKCSSQLRVSTLEHDRRGREEPRLCPQAPLPSDVAEVTLLSPPPVMLSLDYYPQPEPIEPMNTTQAHEDPCDLSLAATYTGAAVSFTDEFAQHADDLETASQSERIWYRNEWQSACQDESTTANSQSKLYHISHPYRPLTDIMAPQSSGFLWSNRLDPRIPFHLPVQSMIDPASLSPRSRLPRRH
ncbi:hypothetical protein F5888DRAFT_368616 [Russula emetica]|nr:hypothetical protein F5888DRAFT_368616 [Russula emetica]